MTKLLYSTILLLKVAQALQPVYKLKVICLLNRDIGQETCPVASIIYFFFAKVYSTHSTGYVVGNFRYFVTFLWYYQDEL